jgi:hypothetical protein
MVRQPLASCSCLLPLPSDPRSSEHLTSAQCERIIATIDGQAVYLRRLLERMGRLGWSHSDRLYLDTVAVLVALRAMRTTLEKLAAFQQAFNEDSRNSLELAPQEDGEYVIDPTKRPWEAGYRVPKREG